MQHELNQHQIKMQEKIELLTMALPCNSYTLYTEFNHTTKGKIERRRSYKQSKFITKCIKIAKDIDFYDTVFFRPDDCRYILIDDLKEEEYNKLRKRFRIRIKVCTSPKNYQVWLYINANNYHEAGIISVQKHITELYHGDIQACKSNQLGRLPCTRNKKSKYADEYGKFPMVFLDYPFSKTQIKSIEEVDLPIMNLHKKFTQRDQRFEDIKIRYTPSQFYIEAYKEHLEYLNSKEYDIHRRCIDFKIANSMFHRYGYTIEEIHEALINCSEKAKEAKKIETYIRGVLWNIKNNHGKKQLFFRFFRLN